MRDGTRRAFLWLGVILITLLVSPVCLQGNVVSEWEKNYPPRVHTLSTKTGQFYRLCCKNWQRKKMGVMVLPHRSYTATPKSVATNVTWSLTFPFSTPCTCPFRSMFMTSNPCNVRHAVSNEKKPIPGFVNRLMKRWSCSIRLPRYFTCRNSQPSEMGPSALSSLNALG
jgi:hypothetical protein